jgi:DNA adenine methylase
MSEIIQHPSKHYSPFRYPGGKACLSGFLSKTVKMNIGANCTFIEPYAGGAGASLTLLFLEKVDRIVINDLDKAIYSFWISILNDTEQFIDKILNTEISVDEWIKQRNVYKNPQSSVFDLGFSTFYLNRTNRSGIIEGGPIGGIEQKGKWLINARFNKAELIDRIKNIASYKSRIKVENLDGLDVMSKYSEVPNSFYYLDPPYYVKGSCLYLNHYGPHDHTRLANFLNGNNQMYWVLTYDKVKEINCLYKDRKTFDFDLNYHIDLPKLGKEILILSDKIILN